MAEVALDEERQEVVPAVVGEDLVRREDEEVLERLAAAVVAVVAVASPAAEVVSEADLAGVSEDVVKRLTRTNFFGLLALGKSESTPRMLLLPWSCNMSKIVFLSHYLEAYSCKI